MCQEPEPDGEKQRVDHAPKPLNRSTSFNTLNNISDLRAWMSERANGWIKGVAITPAEACEGNELVHRICTDSTQTKDAENQCYTLYLDYCRGINAQFAGHHANTAITALQKVFRYLDQHFTNTQDDPQMVRSKQPSSLLCAGQDLKSAAIAIQNDPMWIPDYQISQSFSPDSGSPREGQGTGIDI